MGWRNKRVKWLIGSLGIFLYYWSPALLSMVLDSAQQAIIVSAAVVRTMYIATATVLAGLTSYNNSQSLDHLYRSMPHEFRQSVVVPQPAKAESSPIKAGLFCDQVKDLYHLRQDYPTLSPAGQSLSDGCTITGSPTHIRIEHSSGVFAQVQVIQHSAVRTAIDQEEQQLVQATINTLARAQIDPHYRQDLTDRLNNALNWLLYTNSYKLELRIVARAQLAHLKLEPPYGIHLEQAVRDLEKLFYDPSGKLIFPETRSNEAIAPIKTFLSQVLDKNNPLFNDPSLAPARECQQDFLGWLSNALYRKFNIPYDHHEKIVAHPLNKAIIDCYIACLKHDFIHAQQLRHEFSGSSSIYHLYKNLSEQYQRETFDQYGLYLFGEHDPFIKNIPDQQKKYLPQAELYTFNQLILLRKSIKKNFQSAWSISNDASQAVHDALYAFIPTNILTIPEPLHYLETATTLTNDYTIDNHTELLNALYAPNGVFKDFSQYRYASIRLPELINTQPYALTREALNKLLYYAQTTPDKTVATTANQALAYLQAHFAATDPLDAHCYLLLHHALTDALEGHGDPLVFTLPDLVASPSYSAEQLDVHRAVLATVCTALDLHNPERAWTISEFAKVEKEVEAWIDCATHAHHLNKQGNTQQAFTLLEEYFVKPYQLQNDTPADNSLPKQKPPSGSNTNKDNDQQPKGGKGKALTATAVALKEQIQEAEAYFAQKLVECGDKVARFQKETGFVIQKFDFKHLLDMFTSQGNLKGYHTQIIYNHIQEFITKPGPDRCYKIIAGMHNSAQRFIAQEKTMFSQNWDMHKIIDIFFEAVENYEKTALSKNGTRIALESKIAKQWYRIIIDLPGYVVTFFPFFE